jgi:CRP/FNR family transcriptional regulator, cyclic AMP receptor protein
MSATVSVLIDRHRPNSGEIRNHVNSLETGISPVLAEKHAAELAAEILPIRCPKGGLLFSEGQMANGVFLMHSGRAKESVISSTGKTAILGVVGPGEILGLSAILTGGLFGSTVETLESTCVHYVRKAFFLHLLKNSSEFSQKVSAQLIRNCERANAGIRRIGVSSSAAGRFARLVLEWAECPLSNANQGATGTRILVTLTHEEISQCMGSSRETMTRILGKLRRKKWISTAGTVWTVSNEAEIRKLAAV